MDEEVEEGVFGQRVMRRGEGEERLGWEGWLVLAGLGLVVPLTVFVSAMGLDFPFEGSRPLRSDPSGFDPVRLMIGLGLAAAMLGAALWLARSDEGEG